MRDFVKIMTARVKCFVYGVLILMALMAVIIGEKYGRRQ
jgi:tetrahydromethanopterin S-methyltransferase subunit B